MHQVMKYPKDTTGALMHTDYITLSPEMTARQAVAKIQSTARIRHTENLHAFYVVDKEGILLGGVSLRRLMVSPQDIKIQEIMTKVTQIKIHPYSLQEAVAQMFRKYDLVVAPVVDEDNRLIGIIVDDDITDLLHKLNTKQFYEIGKMDPAGGVEIRYSQVTPFDLVKRRVGWLVLLLVFDFLTGTILKTFEHALSTVVALSFFIPMILDTCGNAGAQTTISIIRGFATGDVTFKNVLRVIRMEIISSGIISIVVGTVAFFRAITLQGDLFVAFAVGGSMSLIVILAICSGIFLPIFSKRIGLDPAVIAGPFITTVVDILGLIIYFKIAEFVLPVLRTIH
ncbi:MAG: magnesium transporter [Elusimicrobiota bacterium]|nr:magnesium transporter [Elusimicrobiota bacterium]